MAVSPSPTFAKTSLPPLASTYQGTIHNTTFDHTATLALTSLVQNQGAISGNAIIGPGLIGSGPFTGTIMSNRSVSFTDVSTDGSNVTIFFTGSLYRDGSLSGTYTIPSTGEEGTWQVIPSPTVDLQTLTIQPLQPLLANSNPTFRATIRNNGSAASGNFNIRWIADGKVFDGGHDSIPAGTVDTHDHIWSNITAGQHTLTFIANFDHTIAETTTRNNQATLTFTVLSDGQYEKINKVIELIGTLVETSDKLCNVLNCSESVSVPVSRLDKIGTIYDVSLAALQATILGEKLTTLNKTIKQFGLHSHQVCLSAQALFEANYNLHETLLSLAPGLKFIFRLPPRETPPCRGK